MRTWIQQPKNKKICGQIAVAVIAGISVDEAIKVVGKKGCTTTKDLASALRKLGYTCDNRCKPFRKLPFPKLAIAQLKSPTRRSGWHWIVIDSGRIYDGINGTSDGKVRWIDGSKITSILEIYEKI